MEKNQFENLYNALKQNVVEVHFKKVNGDTRVMSCTLNQTQLENVFGPFEAQDQNNSLDLPKSLAVLDVNQKAWRSFKPENVTMVTSLGETIYEKTEQTQSA